MSRSTFRAWLLAVFVIVYGGRFAVGLVIGDSQSAKDWWATYVGMSTGGLLLVLLAILWGVDNGLRINRIENELAKCARQSTTLANEKPEV